ncbi:MAG: DinB family protein [Bosea sp. (in: a-proteobacteria)]
MISPEYVAVMARYNRWQNQNLLAAANSLSDAARRENRGAFFGSIQGTFSHLIWGDGMWMSRFAGLPKPTASIDESAMAYQDWAAFLEARSALDEAIVEWASKVSADWLASTLSWYSGAAKRDFSQIAWRPVAHMFNHQTHHRGQIHAMLTQAGAKPGPTDLAMMPEALLAG